MSPGFTWMFRQEFQHFSQRLLEDALERFAEKTAKQVDSYGASHGASPIKSQCFS